MSESRATVRHSPNSLSAGDSKQVAFVVAVVEERRRVAWSGDDHDLAASGEMTAKTTAVPVLGRLRLQNGGRRRQEHAEEHGTPEL